jgi:hypothetical protein
MALKLEMECLDAKEGSVKTETPALIFLYQKPHPLMQGMGLDWKLLY